MESDKISVLLVEGDLRFARALRDALAALTKAQSHLAVARNFAEDLRRLNQDQFDSILTDLISVNPCAHCATLSDATERKRLRPNLSAANSQLVEMNRELSRSGDALRRALADLESSHEQLKQAELQLIQASKMESIGTLAAGVAHEVKNPLQTILMGVAYLANNISHGDETMAAVLMDMRAAVKRADAIVRDLLYLSASKQLELEETGLNDVVEHSLGLVNFELSRTRVSVVRQLAGELPSVVLDRVKMEQVFINLFLNAIQAMPNGGTLTVKTSARRLTSDQLKNRSFAGVFQLGDPVVVAEIQDTGTGIPEEKLSRMFEPFFTTKPTGVGTGLGLPVTKQIIDLHQGAIEIQLASEGGVRVTLMLKSSNGGRKWKRNES